MSENDFQMQALNHLYPQFPAQSLNDALAAICKPIDGLVEIL